MRAGYSLLELMVGLLLLQFGLLATAGMLLQAQRDLHRAEVILRGVLGVELVSDSLEREGGRDGGSRTFPWGEVVWAPVSDQVGGLEVVAVSDLLGDTVFRSRALPVGESSEGGVRQLGAEEGGGR